MNRYDFKNKNSKTLREEIPEDIILPKNTIVPKAEKTKLFNNSVVIVDNDGISLNKFLSASLLGGKIEIPGPFEDDIEASTNGVAIGGIYKLKQVNNYDITSPSNRTLVIRIS